MIGRLLRVYSYIVEAIVSLVSLAMGLVILASPHTTVHLEWLPWEEAKVGEWLLGIGVTGILLVALAALGRLRILLTLFAFAALFLVARGLFFTSWRFSGQDGLRQALWLVAALALAAIGSIPWPARPDRVYRGSR